MKTKIVALVIVAVFSAGIFAGTAWAKESAKVENEKAYKTHNIFKWFKILLRLLKLERSVRKLNSDLDQETMDRESGDRRLKLIIDTEAETREKDDIALGEAIDQEAAARESGDERLANALTDETAARKKADDDLQQQIDSIETGTAKVPIFFSSGADKATPVNIFRMGIGHLSQSPLYGIVTPLPGTIKDLYGFSVLKPGTSSPESIIFELLVNNQLTGLKCEITENENCSNLVDSYIVKAGDTLAIFVFASAGMVPTEVGASVVLEGAGTRNLNEPVLHE